MSEELLEKIRESQTQEQSEKEESSEELTRYLIFSMNDGCYAIESETINAIVTELYVYPLPFVPHYICGLVNQQGTPFVVVDPMIMMNYEGQKSSMLILVKDSTENLSLKITNILDFYDVGKSQFIDLPDSTAVTCFSSSFVWNDTEVLVVDLKSIIQRIETDFHNE